MMERPLFMRWLRVYAVGGAIIGSGVLLYKYSRPTDEELINKFSPEVRREYERNKRLRQEEQRELMKIVQESAESKDPIWKTGPLESPFERGNKNSSYPNNTILERAKRQEVERREREEMDSMRQNLQTLQQQKQQGEDDRNDGKKSWWKIW